MSLQSPEHAKVLSYDCAGNNCGGLGNQIRGLLSVFWLALLTNRTFVINWHRPGKLKDYVEPNLINWNVPPFRFGKFHKTYWGHYRKKGAYDGSWAPKQNWTSKDDVENLLHPLQSIGTNKFIHGFIRSNPLMKKLTKELDIPRTKREMFGCAFHFLFKKTNFMEKALDEARRSISRKSPLLGIHVRTNDQPFGYGARKPTRTHNVRKVFICAMLLNSLIRKINGTTRNLTWFLAADDKAVKEMAKTSFPFQIVTLNLEPKHSGHAATSGTIMRDVFLDIFLLSESDYLLLSPRSSFSNFAASIGNFSAENTAYGEKCLVNETIFLKTMTRVLG